MIVKYYQAQSGKYAGLYHVREYLGNGKFRHLARVRSLEGTKYEYLLTAAPYVPKPNQFVDAVHSLAWFKTESKRQLHYFATAYQ